MKGNPMKMIKQFIFKRKKEENWHRTGERLTNESNLGHPRNQYDGTEMEKWHSFKLEKETNTKMEKLTINNDHLCVTKI